MPTDEVSTDEIDGDDDPLERAGGTVEDDSMLQTIVTSLCFLRLGSAIQSLIRDWDWGRRDIGNADTNRHSRCQITC